MLARFERVTQVSQGEARVGAVFFAEDPAPALRALRVARRALHRPEFAPGPTSVVSPLDDDDEYNDAMREIARRCEWLRPDALATRAGAPAATLFDAAGASSGDLAQGETGDCWLLGAFAALAERHPAWLREDVFGAATLDPWGVCSVRLHVDGRDAWLVVDDRIPWDPVSARPAFVRSTAKGELWPLLLEKAFAKWAGCWQHLRGGLQGDVVPLGDEALRALVGGGDVATVHWRDRNHEGYVHRDALWPVLASWIAEGRVVTAGCADGARGLVSDHVYSLLRVAEVTVAGALQRFVCLRNPWASGEWRGDWGHRSPRWRDDPAARALLAAGLAREDERERDDGAFVMAWEDFVRHFEDATGLAAPPTSAHGALPARAP
ncbi:MAG: C2 family cysteine protease [Polyangiales bacterium]